MTAPKLPLADIHIPDKIALFPPAYGWWILLLVIIILLVASYRLIRNYQQIRRQKKLALAQLASIDLQQPQAWQQINIILKRASMSYFSREQVASLSGQGWKMFLLAQLKNGQNVPFDDQWLENAYRHQQPLADQPDNVQAFYQFAQQWLKQALPVKGAINV